MGIESFLNYNKPGPDFKMKFEEWNRDNKPPFYVIADKFTSEGESGLKDLSRQIEIASNFGPSDRAVSNILIRGRKDAAAIVFGETLFTLEDVIFNGDFYINSYLNAINNGFMGSYYPQYRIPQENICEKIDKEKLEQMTTIMLRDRHPVNLLRPENHELLPNGIVDFMKKEGFTVYMNDFSDIFDGLNQSLKT